MLRLLRNHNPITYGFGINFGFFSLFVDTGMQEVGLSWIGRWATDYVPHHRGGGGRGPHEKNIIIFQTPFELHKPFILRGDLDKIISMM